MDHYGRQGRRSVDQGLAVQSALRARNERLVLTLLRALGPLPKAEIARRSGLSAQTVSVIMRSLEGDGFLVRQDPVRGRVGQPSVPMGLSSDGAFFLGLKVGRRSADLVLIDFLGRTRAVRSQTYDYPTPEGTLAFVQAHIPELTRSLPSGSVESVVGLGVAIPFFLWEWADKIGVDPAEMAAWKSCDLRADLEAALSMPVLLENDMSAACGAELVLGSEQVPQSFLYFFIGYFIGGGLVLDGRLFTGRRGNAGALGPMPVPILKNGKASIEPLIRIASLSTLEAAMIEDGQDPIGLWTSSMEWSVSDVVLSDWIDGAARALAHAIVGAVAIVDVEAALIEGWMPEGVKDRLVQATSYYIAEMDTTGLLDSHVIAGSIGPDARSLGAACLPLSQNFMMEWSV